MILDYGIVALFNHLSIKYQSTNSIALADDLSRLMNAHQNLPEDFFVATVSIEPEIFSVLRNTIRALPLTSQMIQETTDTDRLLQKVIYYHCSLRHDPLKSSLT